MKDHPNLKFFWYEDMTTDMKATIRELSKFTGYHLTDLRVLQLDDLLQIDNFRKAKMSAENNEKEKEEQRKFIRKGVVGDCKNHFSKEMNEKFDNWIRENLEGTDIKLPIK